MSIPEGTTYVVVRGHDRTHGYGGQVVVGNLDTGETEAIRQGPEPRDFSGDEPGVRLPRRGHSSTAPALIRGRTYSHAWHPFADSYSTC
ncbi:hypothetical protein [Salinigranum sp. GCM10025319]|uniref:hypothetical protein n=1 Tax=Salinigranum sp. GCM10025319 TaxID=3252687 RepID=UPI0036129812